VLGLGIAAVAVLVVVVVIVTGGNGSNSHSDTTENLSNYVRTLYDQVTQEEAAYQNSDSSQQLLCVQLGSNFGAPGDTNAGLVPIALIPAPDPELDHLVRQWIYAHQVSYQQCVEPLPIRDSTFQAILDYLNTFPVLGAATTTTVAYGERVGDAALEWLDDRF